VFSFNDISNIDASFAKLIKSLSARKGEKTVKSLTLDELNAVWRRILDNPEAKKALAKLKRDGFAIDHLMPHGPRYPCWADYIASIPFLPNRPSRRQIHRGKTLRKHLPLLKALRQFAAQANDPFCEIRVVTKNETLLEGSRNFGNELGQAADLIEKIISSNWSTRERNPRNTVIASLRWTIWHRTGAPHDSELATLIDAARSAAGKSCIFLDPHTLERIEKREMEGRVKAACRLNYLSGLSLTPVPGIQLSTRFLRNSKKCV
jgi:hypothetical protein